MLGLLARARGVVAAGFDQQFAALAVEPLDLAAGGLGAGGEFGGLDAPLRDLQGIGALLAAGGGQRVERVPCLQPLVGGECRYAWGRPRARAAVASGGPVPDRRPHGPSASADANSSAMAKMRGVMAFPPPAGAGAGRITSADAVRGRPRSVPGGCGHGRGRRRRQRRSARLRASFSRPAAIAACARDSALRARENSAGAYWSASAVSARATACCAAVSSAVGGGRLAQDVSASTAVRRHRACRRVLICAKLACMGAVSEWDARPLSSASGRIATSSPQRL